MAENAYLELKQEVAQASRWGLNSDRVKAIVLGHFGLQRLRRKRIDPILQRGVDEGAWDWHSDSKLTPFRLIPKEDERAVTCSEELEVYDALLEAGDANDLDNWRRDNPVPEEEKDSPFGSDSTLTSAIKEAGLLTEGAPPITVTKATVLVTETKAPEVEEGPAYTLLKDRKGVLDYTLRELLDAVLAHVGSK
jgi:hypothetical protein